MEPISTAILTTIVTYLSTKGFDKVLDTATGEITIESVKWLKSIFFNTDGKPKEITEELKEEPGNELNKEAAIIALKRGIQKDPKAQEWIHEIVRMIEKEIRKEGTTTSIYQSKNVNTGSIKAGGNAIIGDNNNGAS